MALQSSALSREACSIRIVLAGEARVFHVRCNTYNRIDRTTQREYGLYVACWICCQQDFPREQASGKRPVRIMDDRSAAVLFSKTLPSHDRIWRT